MLLETAPLEPFPLNALAEAVELELVEEPEVCAEPVEPALPDPESVLLDPVREPDLMDYCVRHRAVQRVGNSLRSDAI